ncbi:helix-turn-helix transcriptional regulator [Deinococcus hohokamensis]|uniref:Helix-turn-helix transcriptional regulator n=1 Tax=Deinococcus hohokamensis TaxID=309883 RepID=A0ABV9I6Z2_9DEIO
MDVEPRQHLIEHLKRKGPTSIRELMEAVHLSENAVRHHLHALEREGYVCRDSLAHAEGAGRPPVLYALTEKAEHLFPKHYAELLALVLAEADHQAVLQPLLDSLVRRLAAQIQPAVAHLDPAARLQITAAQLHLGGNLSELKATPGGWEFRAYNCPYLKAGQQFEAICDMVPQVIALATGLPAERPACQRDGFPACQLTIGRC